MEAKVTMPPPALQGRVSGMQCPISVSFVLWFMADNKDSDKIISLPMFTGHSRGLSTPSPAGKSTVELDKGRAKRAGSY
ncbi:hypothetical protein EJB05_09060, partial [Eragrostis curvula]